MEYRITLRSNPRVALLFLLILGLPGIGLATLLFLPPVVSIVLTVIAGFFAYNFFKLTRSTLQSRIRTGDAGIEFDFGKDQVNTFRWDEISYAGCFTDVDGRRKADQSLFFYQESSDSLITVPPEYEDFDRLAEEVKEYIKAIEFREVQLEPGSSINDYLKSILPPFFVA